MKTKNKKQEWWMAGILAALAFAMAFYQATRTLPLVDYAYQIENAYRIYLGKIPYKEFGLVLMPGLYWTMALIMKIFGVSNLPFVFFSSLIAAATLVLSFRLIYLITQNARLAFILSLPLVCTGHAIYPFPSYDMETGLLMLAGLYVTPLLYSKHRSVMAVTACGLLFSLPFFFKQNTGLAFLVSEWALAGYFLIQKKISLQHFLVLMGSSLLLPIIFFLWIFYIQAWEPFYFHTFKFAQSNSARSLGTSVQNVLQTYISLDFFLMIAYLTGLFTLARWVKSVWGVRVFVILLTTLFLFVIPTIQGFKDFSPSQPLSTPILYTYDHLFTIWNALLATSLIWLGIQLKRGKISPLTLLIVPIFLTSHASFISQGTRGSTYGIWPFLMILMALFVGEIKKPNLKWPAQIISIFLAVMLFAYCQLRVRLLFVDLVGPVTYATTPALKGLGTPGPWIPQFENLLSYIQDKIPLDEKIVAIPGEDPLYAFSGRTPPLAYEQINNITFPFPPEIVLNACMDQKVAWIIVKNPTQTNSGWLNLKKLKELLLQYYEKTDEIPGYEIYHIKQ